MKYRTRKVTVRFTDDDYAKYQRIQGLPTLCWTWTELIRKALEVYHDRITPTPLETATGITTVKSKTAKRSLKKRGVK